MPERAAFAGGDQDYLRHQQYGDSTNLDVRTALHQHYTTAEVPFPDFCAGLVPWGPTMRVLECGAGAGRFWDNTIAPRSVALTLTDLSPAMVATATANAVANGFDPVAGPVCDVQRLPFDDGSFDLVIANHMLYHVPDPDRAVAELARVLRANGMLLAATNGTGHMRELVDAINETIGPRPDDLSEVFGIDTGEARLRERFGSIVWHAYDNDLVVDDPGPAVAYGLSFPPGDSADEAQAAEFAAAIGRRFVDGVLRIHSRSGAFVAADPRPRA